MTRSSLNTAGSGENPGAHILRESDGTVSPGPLLWLLTIDAALE
jgi:hypothetical protein